MQRPDQAVRFYRGLLWLYPAEFRDHFAREVCLVFADRLREQPTLACLVSMYLGVLIDAPKEHYQMIRQDIVYAWRTMRREKLATITAIFVLALGIGSSTTIFTLANGLMLRPLPYPNQERLVYIEEKWGTSRGQGAVAFPNFLDFRRLNRSLDDFALFAGSSPVLRGDMEAERVPGAMVTASLFKILGVAPLLGRGFTEEEDRPNATATVMLSEDLWRRRYGADPAIVGKPIVLGAEPARVVGVMPRGFHFPDNAEIWWPFRGNPRNNTRTDHFMQGIARLKPGVSIAHAQSDLRAIMTQISQAHPTETYGQTVNVSPFRDRTTRPVLPVLLALLGAVAFVLLIACTNITNLLLLKASSRSREIAVRGALGGSRARVSRQFLVESLMLGVAGSLGGILLAWAAVPALMRMTPPNYLPVWVSFTPDLRMLGFVVAVTLATGLLAGVAPALSAGRLNLVETLKEGGRSSTLGGAKARLRSALVVAEVAMSVLLLAGAGLMIRSFWNLQKQGTGFRVENLTTLVTSPPGDRYPNGQPAATELVRRILLEYATLPGVISVAGASGVPLLSGWGRSFTAEGHPVLSLKDAPMINHTIVTPGYFKTLGLPILEGRDFTDQDARSPLVTMIDAGLARRYWPNQSAVGKRVRYGPPENNEPWHSIVGVVGEARNQGLREVGRSSVYLPYGEFQWSGLNYLVRTNAGLADPASALRARMATIDRSVAVSRIMTMEEIIRRSVWQERFLAAILGFFGALALLLAAVGLYGVMGYIVSQRTHEMGIRMALGADRREIRSMILLQSGRLVGIGLLIGIPGAMALTRYLTAQLYGIEPTNPGTFAAVAAVLAGAGLLASYLPARRATRVDPMLALRAE